MEHIQCPHCNNEFELSSALRSRLRSEVLQEVSVDHEKRTQAKIAETEARVRVEVLAAEKRAKEALALVQSKLAAQEKELSEAGQKLSAALQKETALLKKARELAQKEADLEVDMERRLSVELDKVRQKAQQAAEEVSKRKFAEILRQKEDDMLAQKQLRDAQSQEQISSLKRTIEDLQRKVEQGSQQLQGETQEVLLKELLTKTFVYDQFMDVAKGSRGADVEQIVTDAFGNRCGKILWESKRTKAWSNDWLPKLRDDARECGASCVVLVTQALPPGLAHFGEKDGVWVVSWTHVASVASLLRHGLMEVEQVRQANIGQTDKMQLVYAYLTSPQFKNRMSGVVEAYSEMRSDLDREKKAMLSAWKKREKQLERAVMGMAAFYGDLRGIAGKNIAELEEFELDAPALPDPADSELLLPEGSRQLNLRDINAPKKRHVADGSAPIR